MFNFTCNKCKLKVHRDAISYPKIQEYDNTLRKQGFGETCTLMYCWQECKMAPYLWKEIWQYPTKLHMHLLFNLATPLLGIYSEDIHLAIQIYACTWVFIAALFNCTILETT